MMIDSFPLLAYVTRPGGHCTTRDHLDGLTLRWQ